MAYPVRAVSRPAILNGQTNGKLDASVLVDTPGLAGGPVVRLVPVAARAWRALCATATAAGHTLKATSLTDSYRPYAVQERIFRERYTTEYLAGRPTRTWLGLTWYQRPNTAVAAIPGTSNHGLGLAVDTGEERDGDSGTESLDTDTLNWLLSHADAFGWSWETQSEPWHIRYWAGDNVPTAVLNSTGDDMSDAYDLLVTGQRPGAPSQTYTPEPRYPSIPNTPVLERIWRASIDARHTADAVDELRGSVVELRGMVTKLAEALAALSAAPSSLTLTDAQATLIGNTAGRKVLETLAGAEEVSAKVLREGTGGQ